MLKLIYLIHKNKFIEFVKSDPDALKQIHPEKKSVDLNGLIVLIITLLANLSTIIYNLFGIIKTAK